MLPDQCKFQIDHCELCRREFHSNQMKLVKQQNPKWYTPKGTVRKNFYENWRQAYMKAVNQDPEKVPCFAFEKTYDPYDYPDGWPPEDVKSCVCARHLKAIAEQLEQWQP